MDVLLLCVIHLLSPVRSPPGAGEQSRRGPGDAGDLPSSRAVSRNGYSEAANGRRARLARSAEVEHKAGRAGHGQPANRRRSFRSLRQLKSVFPSTSRGLAVHFSGFVLPASTQPIPPHTSPTCALLLSPLSPSPFSPRSSSTPPRSPNPAATTRTCTPSQARTPLPALRPRRASIPSSAPRSHARPSLITLRRSLLSRSERDSAL